MLNCLHNFPTAALAFQPGLSILCLAVSSRNLTNPWSRAILYPMLHAGFSRIESAFPKRDITPFAHQIPSAHARDAEIITHDKYHQPQRLCKYHEHALTSACSLLLCRMLSSHGSFIHLRSSHEAVDHGLQVPVPHEFLKLLIIHQRLHHKRMRQGAALARGKWDS